VSNKHVVGPQLPQLMHQQHLDTMPNLMKPTVVVIKIHLVNTMQ